MARQRKLSPERIELIQGLLSHYKPEDAQDVRAMLRDLLGDTLQQMLEAEMDDHLGYTKYDYKNKQTDDSRNGYSPKTVVSSVGEIPLDIPRDRKGDFEPQTVKKNQTDISNIEDQVLSMYAKGMTTRDISAHLQSIYGVDASAEMISRMTDRILPIAKEWQNRPLARKYAIVSSWMLSTSMSARMEGPSRRLSMSRSAPAWTATVKSLGSGSAEMRAQSTGSVS